MFFQPLVDSLLTSDPYMVMADYQSYVDCQAQVSAAYLDVPEWNRKAVLNIARVGQFSSDRTIREYAKEIWNVKPVPIELVPVETETHTAASRRG